MVNVTLTFSGRGALRIFYLYTFFLGITAFGSGFEVVKEEVNSLTTGEYAYRGAAAIVVKGGVRYFHSSGVDRILKDSIVEIGSNTKVFTGLLLANTVIDGHQSH